MIKIFYTISRHFIWVYLPFLGSYSVEPICDEWTWIFKIRIHGCHHGQVISNSVLFSVLLRVIPSVRLPSSSPCDLFPCYSSNSLSAMFFLSLYFTPKLFCFLCIWQLVYLRALSTNLLIEFSFHYFRISCFA